MDVFAIRLANLASIVDRLRHQGSLQKEAALALNLSPSYLGQLLGGKKMGEDVARKIEMAHKLPRGWLDTLQAPLMLKEPSIAYGSASHVLRIDPDTIAAALKLVRLSFRNLGLEIDQEENGEPLAFAYDYLVDRQEREVTGENVVDFSTKLRQRLEQRARDAASKSDAGQVGGSDRADRKGRQAS